MEPVLEGSFAIVAIAMLSWMLIWMTQQARKMKGQVEGAIAATLNQNTTSLESAGWGVFTLIFVAVLREGFETVLFVLSSFQQGFMSAISKEHSCILGSMVWNASSILPDDQFPGIVLKSLFGYRAKLYLVQAVSYLTFLITVGGIYFRSLASQSPVAAKSSTASGN